MIRSMSHTLIYLLCACVTSLAGGVAWLVDSGEHAIAGVPLLVALALLAFVVQWIAFVPAFLRQTEHYYDLTGSLTYASLILLALVLGEAGPRSLLLAVLVSIWCARLGSFLFRRVKRAGKDGRFDAIKPNPAKFMLAWTLQGLWVFLTLLAALVAMSSPATQSLDIWAGIGALIWAAGFGIETVADRQKSAFTSDPANQGRFIDLGLWRWSRHPNYFGEMLLWIGICVIALPSFQGWQWLALLSPLSVALLITQVSGVPLLERRADEKWGGDADFEAYKARTPVLLLRPPR